MNKRGTILVENIVFIILNLLFLSILVLFLLRQGNGVSVLEESHSKQIALLIDSAKPGMTIKLDMEKAKKIAEDRGVDFSQAVKITGNIVTVKLSKDSKYEYSFFNDVLVTSSAQKDSKGKYTGMYIFVVKDREELDEK